MHRKYAWFLFFAGVILFFFSLTLSLVAFAAGAFIYFFGGKLEGEA